MKQRNLIMLLAFFVAFCICSCTNGESGQNAASGSAVNQNLFAAAKEINKKCPIATDENTRMDSATVFNEYMITYHYTIHTVSNKDLDLAKFKAGMQTAMSEKYKTDPQLKIYRDNHIAVAYDYKDKTGGFLCYFIVGEK
jgi:hypothetical protein